MPEAVDAYLIVSEVNRRYLTHFPSSMGLLFITRKQAYLLVDFRYIEAAKRQANGVKVVLMEKGLQQIAQLAAKHAVRTIAIEDQTTSLREYNLYCKVFSDITIIVDANLSNQLVQLRSVKDADELKLIDASQQIVDNAFLHILNFIRPGVTEKQIAAELEHVMRINGSEKPSFDTIALAGANTSLPHGVPSDYAVQKGDFVLMDYGATVNGYASDMTRTVCVGEPSDEQYAVYNTVLKAQLAALDTIRAGVVCKEVDAVARNIIEYQADYRGKFGHSLGHGVGLEIHEEPRFSVNCDIITMAGMVVTVEPGVYLEEKFGCRIEDMVVVLQDGYYDFTKSDKKLILL